MSSIFRDMYQAAVAAQAAGAGTDASGRAPAMPETGVIATEYQQLLAALGEDLRHLSEIQSIERRVELKPEMITRYRPWIDGTLGATRDDGQVAPQDDIVSTMLVWAIDVHDWDLALDLARYVVTNGIALPQRYKRSAACLVAEQCAEAGLLIPPQIDHARLARIAEITSGHDMPDEVRAKLHKALARTIEQKISSFDAEAESAVAGGRPALIQAALDEHRRALALDRNSGVKKSIESLERELKKLSETPG